MIGKVAAAGGLAFAAAAVAPLGVDDIPPVALSAYVSAANGAPCAIDWQTLAAVASVESRHGDGTLDADGTTTRIIGSSAGARGPMQFMPATWAHYGRDGNGDGLADVDNVWDAAAGTAALLCANSIDGDWATAVCAYNGGSSACWGYAESRAYVAAVTAARARYSGVDARLVPTTAATALPRAEAPAQSDTTVSQNDTSTATSTTTTTPVERDASALWDGLMRAWVRLGRLLDRIGLGDLWRKADDALFAPEPKVPTLRRAVAPSGLNPTFAAKLAAMQAAAPGAITVSSGHRTADEQWDLRVKHCPDPINSDSTECTPWTAKVGSSPHEHGLAADLAYADDATEAWAHANAARFGLVFPMDNEPWHVEPQ